MLFWPSVDETILSPNIIGLSLMLGNTCRMALLRARKGQ